jgi:capsular exopolysaccharide synthesis family protein
MVDDTVTRGKYLYAKDFPGSLITESYRTLRANILLSNIDTGLNAIVVTSPDRGEGKSTVCANLAIVMAQAEKSVLLMDCDLRLPSQSDLFNLSSEKGLTRMLASHAENEDAFFGEEIMTGLSVIGSGPPPPNPSEFISSRRFSKFLQRARGAFDTVIIDTPPVGIVSDAAILSTMVDGAVVVLDPEKGHRNMAFRAKKALEKVNANLIGIVINNVKFEKESSHGYPY